MYIGGVGCDGPQQTSHGHVRRIIYSCPGRGANRSLGGNWFRKQSAGVTLTVVHGATPLYQNSLDVWQALKPVKHRIGATEGSDPLATARVPMLENDSDVMLIVDADDESSAQASRARARQVSAILPEENGEFPTNAKTTRIAG
jgi:hypothetical protein